MADKNQLKIADQVDLADDDPFAELTRIMGFDPRQPARQATAPQKLAPAPAAVEQASEEDDFSLDLEKELLGEFALEYEASAPEAFAEAAQPVEAPAFEATTPETAAADAPEVDFDFSADFDAAMVASGPGEVPAAQDEYLAGQDAEFDLGLTVDDVSALDAEARQPAAPVETVPAVEAGNADIDMDLAAAMADIDMDFGDAFASEPVAPADEAVGIAQSTTAEAAETDLHLFDEADFRLDDDAGHEPAAEMADIDMDFGDAFASEPVAAAPAEETAAAVHSDTVEAAEADLHLFDDADFRLEDDAEPAAAVEPEPQPAIDESAFSFGEDEFRLDDAHSVEEALPAEEQAAALSADEFSFDDIDFTAQEYAAETGSSAEAEAAGPEAAEPEPVEAEAFAYETPMETPEAVAAPDLSSPAEPPRFEFSVPRYEPRKLPVSPMDVAAEEYRQREATAAPAEPEFNLEDELNALLGNIRSNQVAAATAPAPASPIVAEAPEVEQPAAFTYEEDRPSAYEPPSFRAEPPSFRPEPISFDAPEHPADIEDNLSWDLDDSFAVEPASQPVEEDPAYADEDKPETYAEDEQYEAYAEAEQPEDVYGSDPAAEDDPASLNFDDLSFEPAAEERPSTQYGAAVGAAASRFGSAFASRPFETAAPTRLSDLPRAPVGERFAEHPQAAGYEPEPFSPHRDPVVRGNPLKEDPLDIITQLAEKYSKKEPVTPYGRAMGVARGSIPFEEAPADEDIDISAAFEEQPDVETVDVADQAVALADDLDIPELAEEEELPPVSAYDDLDAEFSSLLSDMNAEPRPAQPASGQSGTYASFEPQPYENQMASQMGAAAGALRQAPAARKAYDDDPEQDSFALDADDLPGSRALSGGQYATDEYDYDPDIDQEIAPQHLAADERRQPKSRGMLLAALVGGVALIGAIGAFAFSYGGGGGADAPALVRADEGPVKVKPENPGGATVPNQDNKVYETVAGEGAAEAPQQEKLVTTAEEPVDVTPPPPAMEEDVAAAPSGKSEDRIEQIVQEAENQTDDQIVAVTPRKVRTMVVKPDGTLVERQGEPGAAPSDEQTETIAAAVPEAGSAPAIPEATGALPATPETAAVEAGEPPALAPAPEETTAAAPAPAGEEVLPPAQEQTAAAEPASEDRGVMPDTAPIAPLRPADQPIDVVGEVKPDQVAAATTAAPDGNWAMQIASQPSEAAAQSSYQDLARRYGSVLQGKEVNIVKAEISGKGTFWRVRVPAATRNEAISLCENYKAAGGNCFVSR